MDGLFQEELLGCLDICNITELDFNKGNDDDDGRDTSGIFNEEGEILTIEPNVGDTSYILGPMASMYYGWWSGGTSTIGYIRESDRKMVNLGTVPGVFDNWDGTTGFNSYGQLTLEQAQWFKNTPKKNDYRAFYPGPPSNVPDEFGRYECQITSTPKPFKIQANSQAIKPAPTITIFLGNDFNKNISSLNQPLAEPSISGRIALPPTEIRIFSP